MFQLAHLAISVDLEVAGFDSEEQRRWRQVAVNVVGPGVGGSVGGGEAELGKVFVVRIL